MNMTDHRLQSALILALISLLAVCTDRSVLGQAHSTQKSYIGQVPLEYPRLVRQTDASLKLHLFGDREAPGYRDTSPVDGIDDSLGRVLHDLAVRFAPIMVQHTVAIPMDFRLWTEGSRTFPLHVDTWEVSQHDAELISAEAIDLTRLGGSGRCHDGSELPDCRLVALLRDLHPDQPTDPRNRTLADAPNDTRFKILYFDFPGHSEPTWKETYEDDFTGELRAQYRRPRVFVHPFIHDAEGGGPNRYEIVLQYWFFYPFNDAGNNHEGDWEHINVVIARRSSVTDALTEPDVRDILAGSERPDDPLVIRRVEYYFHHFVYEMDYSKPNVYQSQEAWRREADSLTEETIGVSKVWERIRWLAYWDDEETEINTHPIGYIGADNKGLDQIMAFPGGKNRDSHGTYPYPGVFKSIGPAGATEEITRAFDHRDYRRTGRDRDRETFAPGHAVVYGRPERVEVVPDWERVVDGVMNDPVMRRKWAWLVLPIHWGYPTSVSPFSTLVGHVDLGNLAARGPAHNNAWNRVGPGASYSPYAPHRFTSAFPLGWVDSFRNDLGFLNLTLPTFVSVPPLDFVWRLATLPVRAAIGSSYPTYYPGDNLPGRFLGVGASASWMSIPADFSDLIVNEKQFDPVLIDIIGHLLENGAAETTVITDASDNVDAGLTGKYQLFFDIGRRFETVNTVRNVHADMRSTLAFSDIPDYVLTARLNLWEYAGSFRFNLASGSVEPFVLAGYGLSWYRVENLSGDGEALIEPSSDWVRRPSLKNLRNLLPNTWHAGFGVEIFPVKGYASPPRGVDIGLKIEFTGFNHRLGVDEDNLPIQRLVDLGYQAGDIPRDRRVWRSDLSFGLTVGF
jgi:hypothetical protein